MKTLLLAFLKIFLPVLGLIGLVGYLFAQSGLSNQVERMQDQDGQLAQSAMVALQNDLRIYAQDLRFLSGAPALHNALAEPTAANVDLLGQAFFSYVTLKPGVDSIRWIDASGREKVRIDHGADGARRVPSAALLDQSTRSYFVRARDLPAETLFLSPVQFAAEEGKSAVSQQPILQIVTALVDGQGKRYGVMVIDLRASELFERFVQVAGAYAGSLSVLDNQGRVLRSPVATEGWGARLGFGASFEQRYASAWQVFAGSDTGSVQLANGVWTWRTLRVLDELRSDISGTAIYPRAVSEDAAYDWRFVTFRPAAAVRAASWVIWNPVIFSMSIIGLLATGLCLWLARAQLRIAQLNLALKERAVAAEGATVAKTDFLSHMSHEIRTPLNAILGLAYLLERADIPASARGQVQKIRVAGRSLLGIINDILDFSKIESGTLKLEHAPFSLPELLDNVATIMSVSAGGKPLELVIAAPDKALPRLLGDRLRLEQVLVNLLSNAIRFTDQGHVVLDIKLVRQVGESLMLRFSVRDTGIGIPAEKLSEIFQAFSQADGSTSRRYGGTGLGLTISRRLLRMMGSGIEVTSVEGSGSEFWFTLELGRAEVEPAPASALGALPVFVVDDSTIARDAVCAIARSLGWSVTSAATADAALKQLDSQAGQDIAAEVFILDWQMPGKDGLTLARELRQKLGRARNPVVVMVTAHSREQFLALPESGVADAVLEKPVTPSALFESVSKALASRRSQEPGIPTPVVRRLARVRILVVDDSDLNREVAQHILEREGAQVTLAGDGKEAVDWLLAHPADIDVVLMDIQMPVMDGYQAVRFIRATPVLAGLPVLALTAGAFADDQRAAREAGMTGYLSKPFDVDVAVDLVRKSIAERASAAPSAPQAMSHLGVDVVRGEAVWEDPALYHKYLHRFVQEYDGIVELMRAADRTVATALAHKLMGSARTMALPDVANCAHEAHRALVGGEDPAAALDALAAALQVTLASISRYAGPAPTTPS